MGHRPPTFRGGVIRYRKKKPCLNPPKTDPEPKTVVEKHTPAPAPAPTPKPTTDPDTSSFVVVQNQSSSSYCIVQ